VNVIVLVMKYLLRSMRNVFNILMCILCCADLLVILSNLIYTINIMSSNKTISNLIPVSESTCHVALAASVFLTMVITIERHQVIKTNV